MSLPKMFNAGVIMFFRNKTCCFCCLSSWWKEFGEILYPDSPHILILCDSGGANGYRRRGWKWFIQENFVNRYNITVTVCRYPVGTSKYNPIERKVFSFISKNWEEGPLTSYEKALGFMRSITTTTGLSVKASFIEKDYKNGIKSLMSKWPVLTSLLILFFPNGIILSGLLLHKPILIFLRRK